MSGFTEVGLFLVSLLFGVVTFLLWLRIAIRYLKISGLSPLGQLAYSTTDPVVRPINRLLKLHYAPGQRYDWQALGLLFFVTSLKILFLSLLHFHLVLPVGYFLLYVLADLIIVPFNLVFYAILIRVVMSYAQPNWQHPVADFLRILTEPLLIIGRKIIPDISGFDFSPFIIMALLKVITLFIGANLPGGLL